MIKWTSFSWLDTRILVSIIVRICSRLWGHEMETSRPWRNWPIRFYRIIAAPRSGTVECAPILTLRTCSMNLKHECLNHTSCYHPVCKMFTAASMFLTVHALFYEYKSKSWRRTGLYYRYVFVFTEYFLYTRGILMSCVTVQTVLLQFVFLCICFICIQGNKLRELWV